MHIITLFSFFTTFPFTYFFSKGLIIFSLHCFIFVFLCFSWGQKNTMCLFKSVTANCPPRKAKRIFQEFSPKYPISPLPSISNNLFSIIKLVAEKTPIWDTKISRNSKNLGIDKLLKGIDENRGNQELRTKSRENQINEINSEKWKRNQKYILIYCYAIRESERVWKVFWYENVNVIRIEKCSQEQINRKKQPKRNDQIDNKSQAKSLSLSPGLY